MITAVKFRHGIEHPTARARIQHRLERFRFGTWPVRRLDVVLDRVPYAGTPACNYQCHISFRGDDKKSLDIYTDKRHAEMAIDDAFDRLHVALASGMTRRSRKRWGR